MERRGAREGLAGRRDLVNPGEIYDGASLDGTAREWKIVYLDPSVVTREAEEDLGLVDFLGMAGQ